MLSNHRHINNTPGDTPPWLKELRLRKRNKQLQQQLSNQSSGSSVAESPQTSSASPFFGASTSTSVTIGGVSTVQQPSPTSRCHTATTNGGSSNSCAGDFGDISCNVKCNNNTGGGNTDINGKMVQERPWIDHTDQLIETIEKGEDSDSSEELKYGPGIVSKLKNRYLNLTLRETSSKSRPSILHLRKATSLEHILDDYDSHDENTADKNENHQHHENKTERLFQRHNNNAKSGGRYNARIANKSEMKRARSVEIISNLDHDSLLTNTANDVKTKQRESLHEETTTQLIEGSGDKTCTTATDKQKSLQIEDNRNFSNSIGMRLNRPKRVQPVMDEKEKPQPDIVKEKKKLFERPELRTKPPQTTGEVAAKVAGFKNIIDSTKASNKKPPIKQKPHAEKPPKTDRPKVQIKRETSLEKHNNQVIGSPIPPLRSPVKEHHSKPESKPPVTPPASPTSTIPDVSKVSPPYEETNGPLNSSLSDTPDLIKHSSSHHLRIEQIESFIKAEKEHGIVEEKNRINLEKSKDFVEKKTENQKKIGNNSIIFSFSSPNKTKDHLPKIDNNRIEVKSPTREVLSPILDKMSPIKEKLSPTKEKSSPPKEKLSPTKAKSSPTKEKPPSPRKESHPPIPKSIPTHEKLKSNDTIANEHKETTSNGTIDHPPSSMDVIVLKSSKQKVANAVPNSEQLKVNRKDNNVELKVNKTVNNQKLNDQSNLLKKPSQSPQQKQVVKNNDVSASESRNNSKLSDKVIEKNLINKMNGSVAPVASKSENRVVNNVTREVPALPRKKSAPKREQQNSLVFDFTSRKDVPDYVGNDGSIKPKEKMRPKMTIRFIDARPEIFEYPSENSLMDEPSHSTTTTSNSTTLGHTVPSLSGSTLANYTPKTTFQAEEFQLGVTPSPQPVTNTTSEPTQETENKTEEPVVSLQEAPIQFSAGTNSDMLF
ncbi:bif [Trypoxylus dichotomus]